MSHLQPGISGGTAPLHAFYILPGTTTAIDISSKSAFATPTATKSFKMIQTAVITPTHQILKSNSRSASASSWPSPSSAGPPPLISSLPPPLHKQDASDNDHTHVAWLAPLLGVLGAMGVILIAAIFFIRRRKYRAPSSPRAVIHDNPSSPSRHNRPLTVNKYASWASCSTINMPAANNMLQNEKKATHMLQPPPAYSATITSKREKRLTADTLVDEHSFSMLKSQYSPQLAFSPSLVAGEFQQQLDHPPLPNNKQQISPSNTLIDNAGVLSDEKKEHYYAYGSQQRIKIEMYNPQVNLDSTDEDADETPCNYPNNQEEKGNVCEGEKHTAADTTETAHQVINMDSHSNANKQ